MQEKLSQKKIYEYISFYKIRFIRQFYIMNIVLFLYIFLGPKLNASKEILGLILLIYFITIYVIYGKSSWSIKEWNYIKEIKSKGSLLEILAGIVSGQAIMFIFSFTNRIVFLPSWFEYLWFILLPVLMFLIFFGINEYYKKNKKIVKQLYKKDWKDFIKSIEY